MDSLVVVSPHFDDAALSCGQFIAGRPDITVVTVFGGTPPRKTMATSYDKNCGFRNAGVAMQRRRHEDRQAMRLIGAKPPVQLQALDNQYRPDVALINDEAAMDALAEQIANEVFKAGALEVMGPLGISHPDHEIVRVLLHMVLQKMPGLKAWVYEDLPSRVLYPTDVWAALEWWKERGYDPHLLFPGTGDREMKKQMVAAYESQLWALDEHCYLVPERFWLVKP